MSGFSLWLAAAVEIPAASVGILGPLPSAPAHFDFTRDGGSGTNGGSVVVMLPA